MFRATIIKVLISSPSDVEEECAAVDSAIHRWNSLHAENFGKVLLPVRWKTHSRPEMGAPAQEILNAQIVDSSDVIIACFGHRIGTPTANSDSGTSEEIERFIEAERPTIIYFSESSARIEEIDPSQLQRRNELRDRLRELGFLGTYLNIHDLSRSVDADLIRLVPGLNLDSGQAEASVQSTISQNPMPTIYSALESHRVELLRDSAMWKSQWETRGDPFNVDAAKQLARGIYQYFAQLYGDIAAAMNSSSSALGGDIRLLMQSAQQAANSQFYIDGGRSYTSFENQMDMLLKNVEELVGEDWQHYIVTSLPVDSTSA